MLPSEILYARLLAQIIVILLFCGKKQILTEICSLAQTTLETKYNRPLPTPQFLLKTFFTCSKNQKNSIFFSMYMYMYSTGTNPVI